MYKILIHNIENIQKMRILEYFKFCLYILTTDLNYKNYHQVKKAEANYFKNKIT